jgi:putative membrane protein
MSLLSIIVNILIILIALEHIAFMVLEMFFWTKPIGLKIFRQSLEHAQVSAKLAANQGLYNGFLAAGLFWAIFGGKYFMVSPLESLHAVNFFLGCIVIAGIYGGVSVSRRILFIQALPAALALAIIHFG